MIQVRIKMYCPNCGIEIKSNAKYCEYCGTEQTESENDRKIYQRSKIEVNITSSPDSYSQYNYTGYNGAHISPKSRLAVFLLWLFLGVFGVHYFYAGRIGMGLLWLLTGGLFGIGLFIDLIVILTGTFKDSYGRPIVTW